VSIPFRDIPNKEGIEIRFPPDVAYRLREKALRERRSIAEVGSELIIRGLGRDPADYGIRPTAVTATA
jgi:hypothetical protein